MARFEYKKNTNSGLKTLLVICLFIVVILVFFYCMNSLSDTTDRKGKESLENALSRSITYCYATEGAYPESLDYIKENYGLSYDENKYYVDYRPIGENILPDVMVIQLDEGK